jgi:aryl-alcohol dehydrogenase-like predicted oxidoreductase
MINRIVLPSTGLSTSVLGAGCASLGSRYARADGLRALGAAFDAGVTWYDVAPAYGAGDAEPILGEFMQGRRDSLTVCSKVGVIPPKRNGAIKLAYSLGRPLLGVAGGLRRAFRKSKATRNVAVALNPEFIRNSLDRTLQRLRTDYVDVLALHKVSEQDLADPFIQDTLRSILKSGKARHISTAGSAQAAVAALAYPDVYSIVQLADNPTLRPLDAVRSAAPGPIGIVTHSVFGVDGAKDRFTAKVKAEPQLRALLEGAGYEGSEEKIVADLLLDRALASNAQGVVLTSMFSPRHLASNVDRASRPVNPRAIELVDAIVARGIEITSVI